MGWIIIAIFGGIIFILVTVVLSHIYYLFISYNSHMLISISEKLEIKWCNSASIQPLYPIASPV